MPLTADDVARETRALIQDEIRRAGVVPPVFADIRQDQVDSPVVVARTGAPDWLVDYEAVLGDTPDAATPAWTEVATETAAQEIDTGVLEITAAAGYLYNEIDLAALAAAQSPAVTISNAAGSIWEASLLVVSSAIGANNGAAIYCSDGTNLWVVWLRTDGLNIDGEAHVAADLTVRTRVALVMRGDVGYLRVNGEEVQAGGFTARTSDALARFGSWVPQAPVA